MDWVPDLAPESGPVGEIPGVIPVQIVQGLSLIFIRVHTEVHPVKQRLGLVIGVWLPGKIRGSALELYHQSGGLGDDNSNRLRYSWCQPGTLSLFGS